LECSHAPVGRPQGRGCCAHEQEAGRVCRLKIQSACRDEETEAMLTGATSLDLVRDELFVSVGEVEGLLQQFLEQRDSGHLLQQAIEGLQQLRGTLNLIELHGAALLLEEMVALAT